MASHSSPLSFSAKEDIVVMGGLWEKSKVVAYAAWSRTTRRMRFAASFLVFL